MATDSPATSAPRWARVRARLARGGQANAVDEVTDSQWAPPYEPDDTNRLARTPEPWPPLPPAPPAQPQPQDPSPASDSAASGSSRSRRAIAIGAGVAVVAAWVGIATFLSPATSKTKTAGVINPAGQNNAFSRLPNAFNGGNRFARGGTSGVIQSVAGPTLTVTDRNGTSVTVHTSDQTVFTKTAQVKAGSFTAGDTIVATGVYSQGNATLSAGRVAILGSGGTNLGGGRPFSAIQGTAIGTVTAIAPDRAGDRLSVTGSDGTEITVIISPSAAITATVAGSLKDMAPGGSITVRGRPEDDGDVDADQIQEGSNGGFFGADPYGRGTTNTTTGAGIDSGRIIQS